MTEEEFRQAVADLEAQYGVSLNVDFKDALQDANLRSDPGKFLQEELQALSAEAQVALGNKAQSGPSGLEEAAEAVEDGATTGNDDVDSFTLSAVYDEQLRKAAGRLGVAPEEVNGVLDQMMEQFARSGDPRAQTLALNKELLLPIVAGLEEAGSTGVDVVMDRYLNGTEPEVRRVKFVGQDGNQATVDVSVELFDTLENQNGSTSNAVRVIKAGGRFGLDERNIGLLSLYLGESNLFNVSSARDAENVSRILDRTAEDYALHMETFGRPELALLALHDLQLAQDLYNNGTPTEEQAAQVQEYLGDYDQGALEAFGFEEEYQIALGMGEGTSTTVTLPNTQDLVASITQQYEAINLSPIDPGTAQRMAASIQQQLRDEATQTTNNRAEAAGNPWQKQTGNTINFEEQTRDPKQLVTEAVEGTSKYQQLYGNKGTGVSDNEWRGTFQDASSKLLSQDSPGQMNQAAMAGMATGDVRTSIGRAAFSEAGQRDTGLQSRLAAAAQTISRFS